MEGEEGGSRIGFFEQLSNAGYFLLGQSSNEEF